MPPLLAARDGLPPFRSALGLIFGLMFILLMPVRAQTQTLDTPSRLQQLEALVTAQHATIDQLKRDYTAATQMERVSTQVEALRRQLETMNATNQVRGVNTSPGAAWRTLGILGGSLIALWGVVSWRRESTAQEQAKFEAVKAARNADTERMKLIAELIQRAEEMEPDQRGELLKALNRILDAKWETR